jgi:hypothetical protein
MMQPGQARIACAIHALNNSKDVDARHKAGHDEYKQGSRYDQPAAH